MADTHVPGALLMEHAAQGVCDALSRVIPGRRALILCGPGNNGGDGYAAARLWQARGGTSHVLELTDRVQGDAAMNRTLALQAGVPVMLAADALPACDAIVDALFGTGLSRDTDGAAAALIRLVNASGKPVAVTESAWAKRSAPTKR
jgi:NAD(P)H-hydrate epimerase